MFYLLCNLVFNAIITSTFIAIVTGLAWYALNLLLFPQKGNFFCNFYLRKTLINSVGYVINICVVEYWKQNNSPYFKAYFSPAKQLTTLLRNLFQHNIISTINQEIMNLIIIPFLILSVSALPISHSRRFFPLKKKKRNKKPK